MSNSTLHPYRHGPVAGLLLALLGSLSGAEALKTDALTVAVPTRDLLMAWPADSPARRGFADEVRRQTHSGAYARSDELFHFAGRALRPLTPADDRPRRSASNVASCQGSELRLMGTAAPVIAAWKHTSSRHSGAA